MALTYWVDIVGVCNLKCPSCPQGVRVEDAKDSTESKFMTLEMFKRILQKIEREEGHRCPPSVHLYSWGEPLLHPMINAFILATRESGFRCGLSTNLNLVKDLPGLVTAGPNVIRVSTSGFFQETYSVTHRNGSVWALKGNMYHLANELVRQHRMIDVQVLYHVYRSNAGQDLKMMIALCKELQFKLDIVWAYLMPVERCLRILEGLVSSDDDLVLRRLAVPLHSALQCLSPVDWKCRMRDEEVTINHDGSVQLCCASFDRANRIAASFLDISLPQLQKRREAHHLCNRCVNRALNKYFAYEGDARLDDIGNANLSADSLYRIQQYSLPQLSLASGEDGTA